MGKESPMRGQLAQDPPIIPVKTILRTDPILRIFLGAINIKPFPAWTNYPAMPTRVRSCRLTGLLPALWLVILRH